MSAPGSYNFTVTRDNLITDALLHIGAIGEGETPSANAVTESARVLNMLIKLRQAQGMPLWAIRRGFVLPFTEASSINTTSHVVVAYETTTISANEASGQTQLSVTSTTNMAASDQIGIEINDNTMHWTTIVSVDSSTLVTITTALDGAASSGNRVFWYTATDDRIKRPVSILDANMLELTNNTSWELTVEELRDYWNLGNRTTTGVPNRIAYEAILGTRAADPTSSTTWYGTIYVYPRFNDGDHVIEFSYLEPAQDLDAASDNPYWPQEFYLPLWLELAALLGPRHGLEIDERRALFNEAKTYFAEALETVQTQGSLFIQPDDSNRG